MSGKAKQPITFAEFELDAARRQLRRDGKIVPLKAKAFDVLTFLAENRGRLVTKEEILSAVWKDSFVEEANLAVQISALRKALNDKKETPRFLLTAPGKGYKFVADMEPDEEIVIENLKFSRLIIEEEGKKERSGEGENFDFSRGVSRSPVLPFSRSKIAAAAILASLAIAALGIAGYFLRERQPSATVLFQKFNIRRLTNTGNVTNAALSPDGKLYAYSIQEKDGRHSLWLAHIDGGESRSLRPAAEATFPFLKFAPDGSSLYFSLTDEANPSTALFKMPAFGGAAQKIKEKIFFAAFSPDGKQFAFVRQEREKNKSALIVADIEGKERELAARPFGQAFVARTVAFSPDGKMLAVAAVSRENGEKQEIFVVKTADRSLEQVVSPGWQLNRAAEWVKDGGGLIIVAADKSSSFGSKIWYLAYPGGEARQIITDLSVYGQLLSLSADSDSLLAVQAHYQSNIWVAPAENPANAKQVTFDSLGKINGWEGLAWMPDGRIIYTARVDESSTIWAINADGRNQAQLTPSDGTYAHLSVSPDADFIVFEAVRSESREIWRVRSDGSDPRQLTSGGKNSQPHVSPDGKWIVYISGGGELRRISIDGGGETLLAEEPALISPRYSPDGKFIAYGAGSNGNLKLLVIPAEGGQAVKQFDTPRLANFNIGIRWTPDGKAVTYRDWANGIWRQNLDGGAPERLKGLPEEKIYAYGWSPDGKQFAFVRGAEIRDVVLFENIK